MAKGTGYPATCAEPLHGIAPYVTEESPIMLLPPRPLKYALCALLSLPPWLPEAMAQEAQRIDLLDLARGAVPVAVGDEAKALGVGMDHALRVIDGDGGGFVMTPKPGGAQTEIVFVYELPALTTFEAFAVPNILETPSPSQTFAKTVIVAGSDAGRDGPFEDLAVAMLATHAKKGETTQFPATSRKPVRWVRVTMKGGIKIERDKTFLEFSELIGHGVQAPVPLSAAFSGKWKGRGVKLELKQDGVRVSGCYDGEGDLSGTVSGNLLHATGKTRSSGILSAFVLSVGRNNEIFGVRTTNGAPFRLYNGEAAPGLKTECSGQAVAPLGCGSTIHGIRFDFDSAAMRPESGAYLDALYDGLRPASSTAITVVGHTSSEGSDAYNEKLSQRRAEAVATALVARGIDAKRVSARGRGEKLPIADNASEAGRSLNRRVEIECH